MTTGFLETIATAPADRPAFTTPDGAIVTTGQIRAAAARAATRLQSTSGPLYLHTRRASLFAAGLLTASQLNRELAILPHIQPDFLAELKVPGVNLLSDEGGAPTLNLPATTDGPIDPGQLHRPPLAFYTSGSTSAPKKAEKTFAQLELEAQSWATSFAADIDAVAGTVSHQHIYGCLFRVFLPVIAGWPSTDIQAFTWEALIPQLTPRTLGVTSPAHLTRIPPELDLEGRLPLNLISSGQALPYEAAADAAQRFGQPPLEILGSTETGGVATRRAVTPDTPWTPLKEVDTRLSGEGALEVRSPFAGGDQFQQMGDRAEILPDGSFRLLARADRIAKVEGKRVSLGRVEAILKAHAQITDARALITADAGRERLSVVLTVTEEGSQALGPAGPFRYSRQLLADLANQFETAERPKRWRFVGGFPRNQQSKITETALRSLFGTPAVLPQLVASSSDIGAREATLRFTMPADLPWFDGHFPGAPILPGLAQVHIAVRLAEEIWAVAPATHNVSRMKFHRVLFPGDDVTLRLSREADPARIRYDFRAGEAKASEGVIG